VPAWLMPVAAVTDLADQAVILPLAALIGGVLAAAGWHRGALAWCLGVAGTLGTMLVLKLLFIACGPFVLGGTLVSPSGHTAAAGVVYGVLSAGIVRALTGRGGWTFLCAVVCAGLVGATRLVLGAHTWPEVLAGGLIGTLGALALTGMAGRPPAQLRLAPAVPVGLALIVLLHGTHLQAETVVRRTALQFWPMTTCQP